MSSSEDDKPLAKRNGVRINGTAKKVLRAPETIPRALDRKLDAEQMEINTGEISLQFGPVKETQIRGKRKAASKPAVKEESDDEVLPKKRQRIQINGSAKKAAEDDSEDDIPLAKKRPGAKRTTTMVGLPPTLEVGNSSDSDQPLVAKKYAAEKREIEKKAAATAKKLRQEEAKATSAKPATKRKIKKEESEESDSDVPLKKKPVAVATKKQTNGIKKEEKEAKPIKRAALKTEVSDQKKPMKGQITKRESEEAEEGDEESEEYKWWKEQQNDGTIKWKTLQHNGVLFPPPYEPLPNNVKLLYNNEPVTLAPAAEEVAGFFGAMLNSQHCENLRFCQNFFSDFQKILKETGGAKGAAGKKVDIRSFDKCDFTRIFNYYEAKREEKKALPAAEKKVLKAEKEKMEEKYMYCYLDGRKEKVGNFRIEPPGLFRGRGDHPKTGMVKARVMPEQVTINIGKGVPIPEPPPGQKWEKVVHDPTVTWLATWKENINGNTKYVMLGATSSLKGMSDLKKFEKSRELKRYIDKIRKDYTKELKDKVMEIRQRATAMYLIDKFALRAGNEKGEDEADTVGCCSLRFEHVTLEPPNYVIFDFLGKDSIRFYNKVAVDAQVFKNLKIFKKLPKTIGDKLFDRVNTTDLNKHLQSYMPGLSAKVFRTYNASWTMQQELGKIKPTENVHEMVLTYNAANRTVAILCNHQRSVAKGHGSQMDKMENKIKAMRYQKQRFKKMILALEPKRKKQDPEFFEDDEELDETWIQEHQEWLVQQEREKIEKKFRKENEKLVAEGEREMKESVLKERLEAADELEQMYKKENETGKVEPEGRGPTAEKYETSIKKLDERIEAAMLQMRDKEDNKTVALGTSKLNYIDPRLTVMFCKKYNVPIEKLFNKSMREKFQWAIESADENWEF